MSMKLFREEAYNNYSSMLDSEIQVRTVNFSNYFITVIILAVMASVMIWFFMGNITETVTVNGIVATDGGNMGVYSDRSGTVSDVFVWNGASVKAGDILAVIPDEEKLDEIQTAIENNEYDRIEKLRSEYYANTFIKAKKGGDIRRVITEGEYTECGDMIAEVTVKSDYADNNRIISFIPSDEMRAVNIGMEVQVSPNYAPREEYGYIKGYISAMGEYPETKNAILEIYSIDDLKNILDDDKSYVTIEITLMPDSESVSNVKWSNPRGNDVDISVGTVCSSMVVVKSCKPYQWFLS